MTNPDGSPPGPDPSVESAWLDAGGLIVAVDEGWEQFCRDNDGDPAACGVGVDYLRVCDGDPAAAPVATVLRAMLSGEQQVPVVFTVPCDGPSSERWYDLHLTPRRTPAGAVEGVLVLLTPVAAPGRGGSHHVPVPDLIESLSDGAVLADADGEMRYVNAALARLSGYAREDLVGHAVEVLIDPQVRHRHRSWRDGYRAASRARMMGAGMPLTLRHRSGGLVPVEVGLAPVVVDGAAMTLASVRDVSDVRARDRARQRLLHLLDLVPDAVYVVDAGTTRIEYANNAASTLLGYPHDQLLTMSLLDLTPGVTEERRRSAVELHRSGGLGYVEQIDTVRRCRDGSLVPCDSRAQLVEEPDDKQVFIVVDRDARGRLAGEAAQARLLDETRLVSDFTRRVLRNTPELEAYRLVAEGTAALLGGDSASIVVHDPDDERMEYLAAVGSLSSHDGAGPASSLDRDLVLDWMRRPEPVLLPDGPPPGPDGVASRKGPGLLAQFRATDGRLGLLSVFRAPGGETFDEADARVLADLADQVALVVELGRGRTAAERLLLVEERQRIARDLHDMVVQDLIAIGMQLVSAVDAAVRRELAGQLDDVIRRLRLVVFNARVAPAPRDPVGGPGPHGRRGGADPGPSPGAEPGRRCRRPSGGARLPPLVGRARGFVQRRAARGGHADPGAGEAGERAAARADRRRRPRDAEHGCPRNRHREPARAGRDAARELQRREPPTPRHRADVDRSPSDDAAHPPRRPGTRHGRSPPLTWSNDRWG
ncbi:MAG: PAS domain S-box protein [Nocardioides sp.]